MFKRPAFHLARIPEPMLGARQLVWVPADVRPAAGVSYFELPLYRPERGRLSGLTDVSNERAYAAGLALTEPIATVRAMQGLVRRPRSAGKHVVGRTRGRADRSGPPMKAED